MRFTGDVGAGILPSSLAMRSRATLAEHVADLRASGVRVCEGRDGTSWVASRDRVAWRMPLFSVAKVDGAEVDHVLQQTGALIASYLTEPAFADPANAWLYLCADDQYSLGMRAPAMRRNVRRAVRELTIRPVSSAEVLANGMTAFCDTRRRTGLDDGTVIGFRRTFAFEAHSECAGRAYLGAWRDGHLAAFLTILHVDDWVELGCFSMDAMLRYRPNDALLYAALSHYLTEQRCRVVSFGVSSIQASTNAAGLHRFKLKIGFDARPVHRAFVLHPSIRPFATRATMTAVHWAVNRMLRVRPRNGALKRFDGMLACMLGATWMMHAADGTHGRARLGKPQLSSKPLCTT